MTRDQFITEIESLLEFKHKNEFRMYSNNLMVMHSKLFFDFCVTDLGVNGSVLYSEILEISLIEDSDERPFMHISCLSGNLCIPASGFDIKTGATVHKIEQYQTAVLDQAEERKTP